MRSAVHRRDLIIASLGTIVLLFSKAGRAASLSEISPLDTAAIPVKSPTTDILIAIAKAGARLVAVGEHGLIIYSDDNAVNWTQAKVPVDVTLTSIDFVTPKLGWAAGHFGVVLNTIDGGQTWAVQLNGVEANQLTMVAAQEVSSQNDSSPGAPLALKRANIFMQAGPDKPFLAILTLSSEEVLVFGAYRMVMRTIDGGRTWSDWSLHVDEKYSNNLYSTAEIGSDLYVVGESGLIFCSVDHGANFRPLISPTNVTLFGVVGANDGSVIVFGVAGNCFRSNDGGRSWVNINLGTQDNLTAGYVLASGLVLIASLSGSVYISHDDGLTFLLAPNTPPMSISGLTQAADNSLIFVGYSGVTKLPRADFS